MFWVDICLPAIEGFSPGYWEIYGNIEPQPLDSFPTIFIGI